MDLGDRADPECVVLVGNSETVRPAQAFADFELLGLGGFPAGSILDEQRGWFIVLDVTGGDNVGSGAGVQPLNCLMSLVTSAVVLWSLT